MYYAPPFTCRTLLQPEAHDIIGLSIRTVGLPGWLSSKESARKAGDEGSVPGLEDAVEKEMATHSSILAWEIPWRKELGRLQFTGLQRKSATT